MSNIETVVRDGSKKVLQYKDIEQGECFMFKTELVPDRQGWVAIKDDEKNYIYLEDGVYYPDRMKYEADKEVIRLKPRNPFEFDIVDD